MSLISFIQQYPYTLAFLLGLIPSLIWLWFWLHEDIHPESPRMITLAFLGGMAAVVLVLPVQEWVSTYITSSDYFSFFLWAALEELFKFTAVYAIALQWKTVADEPVDDMIYLIISALGFVAMENTLFLVTPIHQGDFLGTIMTNNLRFIGASLLHIVSSATVGFFMALSFYKESFDKKLYLACGLILAIILHTTFNLFIINESDHGVFLIFGFVWLAIVLLLLLFEKIKHLQAEHNI